ncbi:hypothetical protein RchiOBHm_Chr7g0191561 [Rosa chinensis]|uniref:Uncharacterized protein n=1 Tax=Rosa chinensis TaxID=74649 RepID=A0A2P6P5B6_ROSCH|nr:hypothetical protein RchiOBHm_Chr7g0191561 [Rosa chinensis]
MCEHMNKYHHEALTIYSLEPVCLCYTREEISKQNRDVIRTNT